MSYFANRHTGSIVNGKVILKDTDNLLTLKVCDED